jgi:hypothetical protein
MVTKRSRNNSIADTPEETIGTYADFRRAIHSKGKLLAGLEIARTGLVPAAIPSIVRKLAEKPIYLNVIVRHPFPAKIGQLKQKKALPIASDRIEAAWTASILSLFTRELTQFAGLRDQYYEAMARSDYDEATRLLSEIQNEFGFSLWLISARISLIQTRDGTPAQKRFLQELLGAKGISGATGYLSYLFGFTAEENVSLAELTREWSRQESFNLTQETIHYFRYHISSFSFSQVDKPWQCVGHEENSALIDRFQTFLEMSALAYMRAESVEEADYIRDALGLLKSIPDRRIQNMLTLFGINGMTETGLDAIATGVDAVFAKDTPSLRNELLASIRQSPAEFSLHEVAARLSLRSNLPLRLEEQYSFANSLIAQFEDVMGLKEGYYESRFALQKTALIHRNSPAARAIISFLKKEDDRIISPSTTEDEGLWAISSPIADPEQLAVLKQLNDDTSRSISNEISKRSPSFAITSAVVFPSTDSDARLQAATLSDQERTLYEGHLAFNRREFDAALNHYREYRTSAIGTNKDRTTRLIYEAAHALDDLGLALQVVADAYLEDETLRLIFPLEEIAVWAKENTGLDPTALDRAIALNIYLQHGSPKYDGDLSDAFEDVLEFYGVEKPSDLLAKLAEQPDDRARWVYFFKEIATIRRLEDGTRLLNYEEIEAERLSVLNGLIQICPELSARLADEVITLTQEREVAQLAEQFDRSRIYVNELGVKQFIEVELRDIVTRYRRLRNAPGLQQEIIRIEGILKKILKAAGDDFSGVILPATEEEDLLYAIYGLVSDSFVLNPDHGLKTYLTTRILHGSIEGELRSSFARQKVLFPSNLDSEFDSLWRPRLRLDNSEHLAVRAAAIRFSRRVTDAINELKNKRIRILGKEAPKGLFDFIPSVRDILELRQQVKDLTESEDFADKIIERLWQKVDRALVAVRDEIEGDFRRRILQAAENLRSTLANITPGSDASKLEDALTSSLTDFQHSVERVLAWFTRSGTAAVKPFNVGTAVQVAARLTNSRFPTQPIDPTIVASEDISIRGTAFSPLLDILRNCFQNAIEHAEMEGRAPSTMVRCEQAGDTFRFEITNEIATHRNKKEVLRSVEAARKGHKSPATTRVGRGTGLREIERILMQEGPATSQPMIDVTDDGRFVISFDIKG